MGRHDRTRRNISHEQIAEQRPLAAQYARRCGAQHLFFVRATCWLIVSSPASTT